MAQPHVAYPPAEAFPAIEWLMQEVTTRAHRADILTRQHVYDADPVHHEAMLSMLRAELQAVGWIADEVLRLMGHRLSCFRDGGAVEWLTAPATASAVKAAAAAGAPE